MIHRIMLQKICIPLITVCFLFISTLTAQSRIFTQIDSLYRRGEMQEILSVWSTQTTSVPIEANERIEALFMVSVAQRIAKDFVGAAALLDSIYQLSEENTFNRARWYCEYGHLQAINSDFETADSLVRIGLRSMELTGQTNKLAYFRGKEILARNAIQVYESDTAIAILKQSVEEWERVGLPKHWQLGVMYQGLQAAYYLKAQLQQSLRAADKGREVFNHTVAPYFGSYMTLQRIRVDVLIYLRDMEAAREGVTDLKKNAELGYGKISDFYAIALQKEGSYLAGMGYDEEALVVMEESARIRRTLKAPTSSQVVADDLVADLLTTMKRYDEARTIQQTILDSLLVLPRRNGHLEGHAWEGLGAAETDPLKAIPLFEKAIALFRESFNRQDCGIDAYILIQLAEKQLTAGLATDALQTLNILHPDTSFSGNWDENLRDYYIWKGIAAYKTGDKMMALDLWQLLVTSQCQLAASELLLGTEMQRLEQIKTIQHITNLLLTYLVDEDPALIELAFQMQIFQKSLLLATAQHIREAVDEGEDLLLKADFEQLTEKREYLVWCYSQTKADLAAENIDIASVSDQVDVLEQKIARRTSDFTLTQLQAPADWRSIQAQLAPDEAAIEVARFQFCEVEQTDSVGYIVFIIRPGQLQPQICRLPRADYLELNLIESYLNQCAELSGKGLTGNWYTEFWSHLEPFLTGVKRIYWSPDGALHKVNISAVLLPDKKYLADHYEVRTVFSLKDIAAIKKEKPFANTSGTAFLVGNPAFDLSGSAPPASSRGVSMAEIPENLTNEIFTTTRGLTLNPLPGSEKEVKGIAHLLQKKGWTVTRLLGAEASEPAVKLVQNPTLLHLATHGWFQANTRNNTTGISRSVLEGNPMLRSMLFFAGAQQALDQKGKTTSSTEGILTAYEAQHLHLSATELVVLSACQTAQGKVQNGDGVYGLQRAFRIAGAKSLIVSLWDVDDQVGREFMLLFYEKWLSGATKSAAFAAAQSSIKSKYPQPFFWAGWVLVE